LAAIAPGPSGIEFLDYDPPRRWAAGSRVPPLIVQ